MLIPPAVLSTLTRRGRRAADQGSPGKLRGVATTTLVLAGIAFIPSLTAGDPRMTLVWLALAGPYVAAATLLLVTMRSPHAQPTVQPVGDTGR